MDDALLERYLDHARSGDQRAATAIALDLLDNGVPIGVILSDLLAGAQRTAGERWQHGEYSVADEHVVTSTTAAAVEVLTAAVDHPRGAGTLTVACAEGDWHALPARLFAEGMRSRGWTATVLGASIPAHDVAAHLARRPSDAVTVTCSMGLYYAGAARLAAVAHQHGTPALIGGAAVAGHPDRALALGADGTAEDLDEADALLRTLRDRPVRSGPVALDRDALHLDQVAAQRAKKAFVRMEAGSTAAPQPVEQLPELLELSLRYTAAALLVDDATVLTDHVRWQLSLLDARGHPSGLYRDGLRVLAEVVEADHPSATRLLTRASDGGAG